jgi:hypothetical protein
MSEKVVPLAVVHNIIVKFLTNGNVKPAESLRRLTAQFSAETLSRIQCMTEVKSFREGWTQVENVQRLHPLQGKLRPVFLGLSTLIF